MDVLESEHLLAGRLAKMVAFAAVHANPACDAEKGLAGATELYKAALHALPYAESVAAANDRNLEAEREQAIADWRRMQEQK